MQQAFRENMQRRFSHTTACLTPQAGRTSGPGEEALPVPVPPARSYKRSGRGSIARVLGRSHKRSGRGSIARACVPARSNVRFGRRNAFFSESRRQIIQKAVCYNIPPLNEKSTRMSAKILKQTADRVQCHLKNDEIEVGRRFIPFDYYPPDPSPEALFWGKSLFFPAVP